MPKRKIYEEKKQPDNQKSNEEEQNSSYKLKRTKLTKDKTKENQAETTKFTMHLRSNTPNHKRIPYTAGKSDQIRKKASGDMKIEQELESQDDEGKNTN